MKLTTTTTASRDKCTAPGICFNPQTPERLTAVSNKDDVRIILAKPTFGVTALTHDVEAEAYTILALLDERSSSQEQGLANLSKVYRKLLVQYLEEQSELLLLREEEGESKENEEAKNESLSVLRDLYTLFHLSEVMFLTNSSSSAAHQRAQYITSELVQFFRQHMVGDVEDEVFGHDADNKREAMMESDQPESWDFEDYYSGQEGDLTPYWRAVRGYCVRGYLSEAAGLLSLHSLARVRGDDREVELGFRNLIELLENAPIPGGIHIEQPDDDHTNGMFEEDFNFLLENWYKWSNEVNKMLQTNRQIRTLLSILPEIKVCVIEIITCTVDLRSFDDWVEAVLVELLYKTPYLPAKDIWRRADNYIQMVNDDLTDTQTCVLEIMQYNAGTAIQHAASLTSKISSVFAHLSLANIVSTLLCELLSRSRAFTADWNHHPLGGLLEQTADVCFDQFFSDNPALTIKIVSRLLMIPSYGVKDSSFGFPSNSSMELLKTLMDLYLPEKDVSVNEVLILLQSEINRIESFVNRNQEKYSIALLRTVQMLYELQASLCFSRCMALEDQPGGYVQWLLTGALIEQQSAVWFEKLDGKEKLIDKFVYQFRCHQKLNNYCHKVNAKILRNLIPLLLQVFELEAVPTLGVILKDGSLNVGADYEFENVRENVINECQDLWDSLEQITIAIEKVRGNTLPNASAEPDFCLLGPITSAAFDLFELLSYLVDAVDKEDYMEASKILMKCLREHVTDDADIVVANGKKTETKIQKISMSLSHTSSWIDILLISYILVRSTDAKFTFISEVEDRHHPDVPAFSQPTKVYFSLNDIYLLVSKLDWLVGFEESGFSKVSEMFQASVMPALNIQPGFVDWQASAKAWVRRMRVVISQSIIFGAIDATEKKRQERQLREFNEKEKARLKAKQMTIEEEVEMMLHPEYPH